MRLRCSKWIPDEIKLIRSPISAGVLTLARNLWLSEIRKLRE
jgi:hypothetical protein